MKMFKTSFFLLITLCSLHSYGQRYLTRNGEATFFSDGIVEDITASSGELVMAVDIATGDVIAKVPMTSFSFKIKLMQEHFNENYVESHIYPEAVFRGVIQNIDPAVRDTQNLIVKGTMDLHGVKREMQTMVKLLLNENNVYGEAVFPLAVKEYNIKIPRVVVKNIAEVVEVTVKSKMQLYE
jgi:hypothetical protein